MGVPVAPYLPITNIGRLGDILYYGSKPQICNNNLLIRVQSQLFRSAMLTKGMGRLNGKLAFITGGNSGIGLATAKAYAAEGARVAISGRDPKTLEAAKNEIGSGTLALACDVSDLKALDSAYASIKEQFGFLDIVFANAGIFEIMPLEQVTEEHFDRQFSVNVKGLYFTVQKSLPLLRPGSSIILNSSIAYLTGTPGGSVYSGTKGAVRAFARGFASELSLKDIRVNVITPGPIDTPIWDGAPLDLDRVTRSIPLGRFGTSQEIASALVFLASDESTFMTGSEIVIDGGRSQTAALPRGKP
jgi:NAD(P)-dependent dehydrogenase (short-subunit alcohol dehydrogenase family)